MNDKRHPLKVAVVGVCASGKSTLIEALRRDGYQARHVAQEHSYVPAMWQRFSNPDVLIYLDADYETIAKRRPRTHLSRRDLGEQYRRLEHARHHCHLYLDTTDLTPDQVHEKVIGFLDEFGD